MGRCPHPHTRTLGVCITGFSHVYCLDCLSATLLSQGSPWNDFGCVYSGQNTHSRDRRGSEEPLTARTVWVNWQPHPSITSSITTLMPAQAFLCISGRLGKKEKKKEGGRRGKNFEGLQVWSETATRKMKPPLSLKIAKCIHAY